MAIALLALSCVDAQTNPAPIPAEARWLVFLELDRAGVLLNAVGPVPVETPLPVALRASRPGRRLVLGYTEESIRALAPELDTAALASQAALSPPRLASGCDPRLPEPVFESELEEETWKTGASAPPLTASWLEGRCPEAEPELWFDFSECGGFWCPRERRAKGPCTFEVNFSGCQLSPLEVRIEGETLLCGSGIEGTPERGREPSVLLEDGFGVQCRVRVAARQTLAPTIRRWSLGHLVPSYKGPEPRFLGDSSSHWLSRGLPYGGLADFVVLNDRVVVSLVHGPMEGCLEREPSGPRLARFLRSGEELTEVGTATASPCLYHLEPDPNGESFLGVYVTSPDSVVLGRFDREGREVKRSEISVELNAVDVHGLAIHDDAIFVTLRGEALQDLTDSAIIRFSRESLAPELERSRYWRAASGTSAHSIKFGRVRSAGRFLLVNEIENDTVHILDPEQGFVGVALRGARGGVKISDLTYDPGHSRLFVAGRDFELAGFVAHAGIEPCFTHGLGPQCDWTPLQFAGEDSIGLRLSAWPGRSDLLASFVGVQRGDRVATLLSVIDLAAEPWARYRPVAVEVSDLSVFTVHADETSLWALVPEDAALLRITP